MTKVKIFVTMMLLCSMAAFGQTAKGSVSVHELTGKATYYGNNYRETRRTANGDRFDKNAYTAAHKTLPFGTVAKVTNKKNGKSVTVRINDRGPFGEGRIIDVTPVAARELEIIRDGVVPCEVEIISMPVRQDKKRG